jgi:hypothetical protein
MNGRKWLRSLYIACFVSFVASAGFAHAYVNVKGYYRSNGTYVAPHVRSNPNGLKSDNYGYTPSQGTYNKTYGTRGAEWDTPTTITDPDYFLGKALYESGKSGNVSSPSTEITPTRHYAPLIAKGYEKRVYKTPNENTVWELSSWSYYNWGTKKPFKTAQSFLAKGYKWSDIKTIAAPELAKYSWVNVGDFY